MASSCRKSATYSVHEYRNFSFVSLSNMSDLEIFFRQLDIILSNVHSGQFYILEKRRGDDDKFRMTSADFVIV